MLAALEFVGIDGEIERRIDLGDRNDLLINKHHQSQHEFVLITMSTVIDIISKIFAVISLLSHDESSSLSSQLCQLQL